MKKGIKMTISVLLIAGVMAASFKSGTIFSQNVEEGMNSLRNELTQESQERTENNGNAQNNDKDINESGASAGVQQPLMPDTASQEEAVTPSREDYDINGTTLLSLKISYIENLRAEQRQNIHVVIPSGVTQINEHAFDTAYPRSEYALLRECRFISLDLTQASDLKVIGAYAFYNTTAFKGDLNLPQGLETIGNYAFYNSGYDGTLHLPASVTTIGDSAFRQSNAYHGFKGTLQLPGELKYLGKVAFSNQRGITSVEIPEALNEIPESAFRYTGVHGVLTIPNNITSVGANAFGDTSLQTVYLPSNITIVDSSFNKAAPPYLICNDKIEYDRLKALKTKFKIAYEIQVTFDDKKGGVYAPITRLYNQPYNIVKQEDGNWTADTAYAFPAVQSDERMKWALSADAVAECKVTDAVSTTTLYAALIYENPKVTYSDDVKKVYDGNDVMLSVKAQHPYATTLDKAKEGDVVFYYWWNWETLSQTEYVLKGWGEDTYRFQDIRAPYAISCRVTVQAYRIKNNKTSLFYTTRHSFAVDMSPAEAAVHPLFEKENNIDTGLPEIQLSDGDTLGTIAWDAGQIPQPGTHSYAWTFIPEKNAEGQHNYKETKGMADITFMRYQTLDIQKAAHGRIQTDTIRPAQGQTVVLTFVPATGYHLKNVNINGVEYSEKEKGNQLTLSVQTDLTIQAVFEKIKAEDIQDGIDDLAQNKESFTKEEQQTVLEILSEYSQMENASKEISEQVKETMLNAVIKHPQLSIDMNSEKIYATSLTAMLDELKSEDIQRLQRKELTGIAIHMEVNKTVDQENRASLKELIEKNKLTIGTCYDVKILKTLMTETDEFTAEVKQLSKPVLLTFSLPQELAAPNGVTREFYILRMHENADGTQRMDLLETLQNTDNEISVYSDRFSTYAIVYRDTPIQTDEIPDNSTEIRKKSYVITADVVGQGSITPQGTGKVTAGESMSYTFKPYRGYHVQVVVVDGKSMGELDSYTFSSVSENHTIHVIFEKDEVKAEHTKLEHADSAGVQKSSPEKSQTAVKHTAADTFDFTRIEIWLLAGVVSIFAMLCTSIYRFKRR